MPIIEALQIKLRQAARAALAEMRTVKITAHDPFLQGREALFGAIKDGARYDRSIAAVQRAIGIDLDYPAPCAALALSHTLDFPSNWTVTPRQTAPSGRPLRYCAAKGAERPLLALRIRRGGDLAKGSGWHACRD